MTHSRRRRRQSSPLHHEPEAVIYAREKAGLTRAEVARLVGISPQLMGYIERGIRNATPPTLQRLAEALNCPVVVLERKREHVAPPAPDVEQTEAGAA